MSPTTYSPINEADVAAEQVRIKLREELLWKDMHSLRDIVFRTAQWGITVLTGLQTAISFVRKDTFERMVKAGELAQTAALPLDRYLVGLIALIVVASLFSTISIILGRQWSQVRHQLKEAAAVGSGIALPSSIPLRWAFSAMYFVFPLLDLLIRIYLHH